MKNRQSILLLLCLLASQLSHAEYFKHLGRADGLSQSSVMAIYQDQLGRLWFGTREGVNLYNKEKMTVYKGWIQNGEQPDNKLLIGNEVEAITGDKNGDVFLIVDEALMKYDIRKETFTPLRKSHARAVTSSQGDVWCAIRDSIFQYNPQSGQLDFRLKTHLSQINYLAKDGQQLYIGALTGLYVANVKGAIQCLIPNVDIYRIFKSSQDEWWIACRTQGLYRINAAGVISKVPYDPSNPHAIASRQIRELVEDRHGNIWFGTFNGLQKYNPRLGTYSLISQEQRPGGLNHSSIFSLYQDVQGTIWIGSYYGGVNYFNPDNNAFNYFSYNPDRNDCLRYPFAGAMTEDNNRRLWICTDGGGLACLDRQTGLINTFVAGSPNSVPHNNLKSICHDPKRDQLYIGTHLGGLSRYDCRTGEFYNFLSHAPLGSSTAPNDVIFHVAFEHDRLFVSARNGLFTMNPDTKEFKRIFNDRYYQTFSVDPKGNIWLAGPRSIHRVDAKTYAKTDVIDLGEHGCQFSIVKILMASNGKLYITTLGSGLFCYDSQTKKLTNYTSEEDQLLSNYCYNLQETADHNILITNDRGITLFNQKIKTFRSIELGSGLTLSSIINGCGAWICSDGKIFIGGTGGLVSFFEKDLNTGYYKPQLYFSSLSVNNTRISPDDNTGILTEAMPFTQELCLNSAQNNLSIEFATSNYVDILNNSWYEYKLEGFDKEWIATSQTSIKYTNLDPGSYVLHIREKSTSPDSENVPELLLAIHITPPWYLTWWASLSFILIVGSITIFILRERSSRRTLSLSLAKEKLEKEHIAELNQAKLRFFTNVSHEFRTPLTLIISQVELILQNDSLQPSLQTSIGKIKKHAQQMKQLITELLDFRKLEQNYIQLKLSEQNLNTFFEEIFLSFSAYAVQKQMVYNFTPAEEGVTMWIDDWQMRKVFFNLLSNAFKHTPEKGMIHLTVSRVEEEVVITVKDSGNGITQEDLEHIFDRFYQADSRNKGANAGTGIGLALTKSIVQLHHGTISVESSLNQGSSFTVRLPLDRKCYENDPEVIFTEHTDTGVQENSLPDKEFLEEMSAAIEEYPTDSQPKKHKVLLVEDNPELLRLLENIFSPLYLIATAQNGEEGLKKVTEEMPDLIVSDVMMPIMSGTEMCKKIKNNLHLCHIPVVLLTALDSVEQNIEGLNRGADDYITKPFNAKILLVRCNNLIRNRLLTQSRFAKDAVAEVDLLATNPMDKSFLDKVTKVVDQYLDNEDLDISVLCRELGVGRTLLHTKFKALTGMTPNEFILNYKLKKAAWMLRNEPYLQVGEISDRLGFGSPRYFTRCFKNQFNTTPQEYRKENIPG